MMELSKRLGQRRRGIEAAWPGYASVLLLAIVAFAIAVRVVRVGSLEIGADEGQSVYAATSPGGILYALRNDTNPPLYYLLLKGWMACFGEGLGSIRAMSGLFGVLTTVAVGGLLRQCGAGWRTMVLGMLLMACAPLQIYYAQEARGYTLSLLLLTLGLWTFAWALESGRGWAWLLHGVVVGLGFYAHNLMMPVAAGYWIAATLMRVRRGQWVALAAAHGAAAIAALPVIGMVMGQLRGVVGTEGALGVEGGLAWIAPLWQASDKALLIPQSLEVLGLGGWIPRTMAMHSLPGVLTGFAIVLTMLAGVAAFWPKQGGGQAARRQGEQAAAGWKEFGARRWILVAFTIWPLGFLFVYSCVRTPLYVVGRYDLFAQPAYICLLAAGFSRLQGCWNDWRGKLVARVLPALVLLVCGCGMMGRWSAGEDLVVPTHWNRAEYLSQVGRPGDLIICTGLEASQTLYYLHVLKLPERVETLPRETLDHIGWMAGDEELAARAGQWPGEAAGLLEEAESRGSRIWIYLDYPSAERPDSPRGKLAALLQSMAAARGWRLTYPDRIHRDMEGDCHIVGLTHEGQWRGAAAAGR